MPSSLKLYETPSGFKYHLFPDDAISNEVRDTGYFEKYLFDLASIVLSFHEMKPGLVLDIGANLGTFSIPLASKFPKFYFCAFEPLKFVYDNLLLNVSVNDINNIKAYNVAMSNETKIEMCNRLPYDCINVGGNSLIDDVHKLRAHEYGLTKKVETELIQFHQLDNYNFKNICLIKLDVEGMELDALEGSIQTIRSNNLPPIIFESWLDDWHRDKHNKLFNFLKFLGYSSFIQFDNANFLATKDLNDMRKYGFCE